MNAINLDFIQKLNTFKEAFACSTESLDRTVQHNKSVGGASRSRHLSTSLNGCDAADLILDDPREMIPAAIHARKMGFGGIEADLRNYHLHLDGREIQWHVVVTHAREYTLNEYLTEYPMFL